MESAAEASYNLVVDENAGEHGTEIPPTSEEMENRKIIKRLLVGIADMVAIIGNYKKLKDKIIACELSRNEKTLKVEPIDSCKSSIGAVKDKISSIRDQDQTQPDLQFTPQQIAMMIDKFQKVGSDDFVPVHQLEFVLEDIGIISPTPEHLQENLTEQRNRVKSVNWKNFVIDCMGVPLPVQEQLLEVLAQFKILDPGKSLLVDKNQFDLVTLWFESTDAKEIARDPKPLIWRECLFQMLRGEERLFPYMDFLLHFCKDQNAHMDLVHSL